MIIASVFRSGGSYSPKWVRALARGVADHCSCRFVCLSDVDVGPVERIPLMYGWPGWWSKLELFRSDVFDEPVLYLDLDTLVVGDLTPLLTCRSSFAMLSDFFSPQRAESGVMAWVPGPASEDIWAAFRKDPWKNIHTYRRDGRFIAEHSSPDRLQDLYPARIVSLKVHARKACPAGASLCCGHGRPRFSEPEAGWAHDHWLGLIRETQEV